MTTLTPPTPRALLAFCGGGCADPDGSAALTAGDWGDATAEEADGYDPVLDDLPRDVIAELSAARPGSRVLLALNCGIGSTGFLPGNQCAKGGYGRESGLRTSRVTKSNIKASGAEKTREFTDAAGRKVVEHRTSDGRTFHEVTHVSGRRSFHKVEGPAKAKAPAAKSAAAPLSSATMPEFAKAVQKIADEHDTGYGDNKVYIHHVYQKAKELDPSLTEATFKNKLKDAATAGHVELSRADMTVLFHPDDLKASYVNRVPGADALARDPVSGVDENRSSHLIVAKNKDRAQVRDRSGGTNDAAAAAIRAESEAAPAKPMGTAADTLGRNRADVAGRLERATDPAEKARLKGVLDTLDAKIVGKSPAPDGPHTLPDGSTAHVRGGRIIMARRGELIGKTPAEVGAVPHGQPKPAAEARGIGGFTPSEQSQRRAFAAAHLQGQRAGNLSASDEKLAGIFANTPTLESAMAQAKDLKGWGNKDFRDAATSDLKGMYAKAEAAGLPRGDKGRDDTDYLRQSAKGTGVFARGEVRHGPAASTQSPASPLRPGDRGYDPAAAAAAYRERTATAPALPPDKEMLRRRAERQQAEARVAAKMGEKPPATRAAAGMDLTPRAAMAGADKPAETPDESRARAVSELADKLRPGLEATTKPAMVVTSKEFARYSGGYGKAQALAQQNGGRIVPVRDSGGSDEVTGYAVERPATEQEAVGIRAKHAEEVARQAKSNASYHVRSVARAKEIAALEASHPEVAARIKAYAVVGSHDGTPLYADNSKWDVAKKWASEAGATLDAGRQHVTLSEAIGRRDELQAKEKLNRGMRAGALHAKSDDKVLLSGNTFAHKDKISAAGFRFDRNAGGWVGEKKKLPAGGLWNGVVADRLSAAPLSRVALALAVAPVSRRLLALAAGGNCGNTHEGFAPGNHCQSGGSGGLDPHLASAHAYAATVNDRVSAARSEAIAAAKTYAKAANAKYAELRAGKPAEWSDVQGGPDEEAFDAEKSADADAAVAHARAGIPDHLRDALVPDIALPEHAQTLEGGQKLSAGDMRDAVNEYHAAAADDIPDAAMAGVPAEHRPFVEAHASRIAAAVEYGRKMDPARVFAKDDEGRKYRPGKLRTAHTALSVGVTPRALLAMCGGGRTVVLSLSNAGPAAEVPPPPGMPTKTLSGRPIHYLRKQAAVARKFVHRGTGSREEITPARLGLWVDSHAKLSCKGIRPYLYPFHVQAGQQPDASRVMGDVLEMTATPPDPVTGEAGMDVLLKLYGDEALHTAEATDLSVTVVANKIDDEGNVYPEAIDHIAFTPSPALSRMRPDYVRVLAASGAVIMAPNYVCDAGGCRCVTPASRVALAAAVA